jgi:hypothetical protein
MYLDDTLTETELTDARDEMREARTVQGMMFLLSAIKTSEWHRYTGASDEMFGYACAGTTGKGAIDMRCALVPPWGRDTSPPQPIEYRRVAGGGEDLENWTPTGYQAVMRYDTSRDHEDDGEGYEFIPYRVTELRLATNW